MEVEKEKTRQKLNNKLIASRNGVIIHLLILMPIYLGSPSSMVIWCQWQFSGRSVNRVVNKIITMKEKFLKPKNFNPQNEHFRQRNIVFIYVLNIGLIFSTETFYQVYRTTQAYLRLFEFERTSFSSFCLQTHVFTTSACAAGDETWELYIYLFLKG